MHNLVLSPIDPETLINSISERVTANILKAVKTDQKINPYERLTRKDVSEQYRVCLGTLHNAMRSGKLPYEKVGRKTLYKRTDVENWLKKKGGSNE